MIIKKKLQSSGEGLVIYFKKAEVELLGMKEGEEYVCEINEKKISKCLGKYEN